MGKVASQAPSGHKLITYRATFLFQLANTAALALTQKVALRCHGPRKHMVQLSYGATFLMCTYPESCVQGDPRKHMVQLSYYEGCKKKLFPELDWRIEIYIVTFSCERPVFENRSRALNLEFATQKVLGLFGSTLYGL